jgi:hypothetical protein
MACFAYLQAPAVDAALLVPQTQTRQVEARAVTDDLVNSQVERAADATIFTADVAAEAFSPSINRVVARSSAAQQSTIGETTLTAAGSVSTSAIGPTENAFAHSEFELEFLLTVDAPCRLSGELSSSGDASTWCLLVDADGRTVFQAAGTRYGELITFEEVGRLGGGAYVLTARSRSFSSEIADDGYGSGAYAVTFAIVPEATSLSYAILLAGCFCGMRVSDGRRRRA